MKNTVTYTIYTMSPDNRILSVIHTRNISKISFERVTGCNYNKLADIT